MENISKIKKELENNLFLFSTLGFISMLVILFTHNNYLSNTISKASLLLLINFTFIPSIIICNKILFNTKRKINKIIPLQEKENSYQIVSKARESSIPEAMKLEKNIFIFATVTHSFSVLLCLGFPPSSSTFKFKGQ